MLIIDDKVTPHDGRTIRGYAASKRLCVMLLQQSVSFYVEPLPADHWRFTVNREALHVLNAAIKETA